jgi:hypothetical protein
MSVQYEETILQLVSNCVVDQFLFVNKQAVKGKFFYSSPSVNSTMEELSEEYQNPLIDLCFALWYMLPWDPCRSIYRWAKDFTFTSRWFPWYFPEQTKSLIYEYWYMPRREYIYKYPTVIDFMLLEWTLCDLLISCKKRLEPMIVSVSGQRKNTTKSLQRQANSYDESEVKRIVSFIKYQTQAFEKNLVTSFDV